MTLEELRRLQAAAAYAVMLVAQGAEQMERARESFLARGGLASINALIAQHPEAEEEITAISDNLADIATVATEILGTNGVFKPGSATRATMMRVRQDL